MFNKRNAFKHLDFLLLDILCLILSFILAYFIRHNSFQLFTIEIYKDMFVAILAIELLIYFFYDPFKYVVVRGRLSEFKETLAYDIISFILAVIYLFAVKATSDFSRLTLVYTYVFYFITSYITRVLWKKVIDKKSSQAIRKGDKSLLIVTKQEDLEESINAVVNYNYDFYQISGIYVIDKDMQGEKYNNFEIVANNDTVLDYVSKNWVDEIFIASDYNIIPKEVIQGFVSIGIPIHVKLDSIDIFGNRPQSVEKLWNYNIITSVNRNYKNWQLFIKRLMDIVGGIIGCLLTILLIIIIGPIIYIKSPGNIFYVSKRVGKNGKLFNFYKFRSMNLDADEQKENLAKDNRLKDGMMFKIDNDPRIIPGIGNFIRKTSIDEFPQFFNVLKGDMSLVGTRPPTLDEWNKYIPQYRSRLSIKPGITGMWQVSGRSNITDFDEVVKLDNKYINEWSLSLDIKILVKTITMIFNNKDNGAM